MAYNPRMTMAYGHGPMGPPSYTQNHQRNSPSSTGAEALPSPYETHSYPQHTQSPSQTLPLPLATTQSPASAYPQMRTATPNLNLSSGPQFSLPSVNDQSPGAQGHRPYGQMAPPQPYSPGGQPNSQYGLHVASHLRPTWPQGNMQPPMMAPHPSHAAHMNQQPHMMFHPAHAYHPAYFGQGSPVQERPFKCEQCKAAFSRNHDLKRHKRIHLAVKPFPCDFCEKTFTRKDALKVSFTVSLTIWGSGI